MLKTRPLALLAAFAILSIGCPALAQTRAPVVLDSAGRPIGATPTFQFDKNGAAASAATPTDKGGTLTTGGVAQVAIAANTSRKAWCISNDPAATELLQVRDNGTASATTGTPVQPGQQVCNSPGLVSAAAISVFAATTGHRWFGFEAQ